MAMEQPANVTDSVTRQSSSNTNISEQKSRTSAVSTKNEENNTSNKLKYFENLAPKIQSFKRQNFGSYQYCSKILIFICIVFIVCHFILAILYWLENPEKYCETAKCLRSAALLKLSMNLSADPCQDFFKYTCGRWSKEHPLTPHYSKYSKFTDASVRVNLAAQAFLAMPDEKSDISSVKKCRMYYRSCMDKSRDKVLGFTTIFEYLQKTNLPIVPSLFSNETFGESTLNWVESEAKLKKILGIQALIDLHVRQNRFKSPDKIIYIGRPYMDCHTLGNEKTNGKARKVFKYVVNEIIYNVTGDKPSDELLEEARMILENYTKSICGFGNVTFSPDTPYHTPYKLQKLQDEIDHHMSKISNRTEPGLLKSYIGYIFDGIEGVIIDFKKDFLYIRRGRSKPYVMEVLTFIYSQKVTHTEIFLWWTVVASLVRNTYLSKTINKFHRSQKRLMRKGSKRQLELACARELIQAMPYAVAFGIMDEKFKTSTGQKVRVMVEQLRDEMRNVIKTADWLDDRTKTVSLEKLSLIHEVIGVPDWLFEKEQLDEYYRKVEMNSTTYLRNKLQITELNGRIHYKSLRNEQIKFAEFPTNPLIVNAFNMHLINSIGLQFDKDGNLARWWPEKSQELFQEKASCFKEQYNKSTLESVKDHVSGSRTINENIADNGGMTLAYSMYRKYENSNIKKKILPGFENFTDAQLFFIAYGNLWCYTSTKGEDEYSLKNDVHSPGSARVNVVLQNNPHFSKVFNCPMGSKMNPTKKCKIW